MINNKVNLSIKEAKNVWDTSLRKKLLSWNKKFHIKMLT
jgi:hypothetical protein